MDNLELDDVKTPVVSDVLYDLGKYWLERTHGGRSPMDHFRDDPAPYFRSKIMAPKSRARKLFDQLAIFEDHEVTEFFEILGEASTAEVVYQILNSLTKPEKERYAEFSLEMYVKVVHPALLKNAIDVVRKYPNADFEQLADEVNKLHAESTEMFHNSIAALEREKLEEKRNRKPSLGNIKRNVDICNLRLEVGAKGKLQKNMETKPLRGFGISKRKS